MPFSPGGIADITARAVAEHMSKALGQPVVVENKPSAGSIVASQAVATAKPDGHTLLLMSNGNAVSVGLFKKLPYDPVKDFAPISTLGYFDNRHLRRRQLAVRQPEGAARLRQANRASSTSAPSRRAARST